MHDSDSTRPLLVERQDAIVTLRFNRPAALNAIDVPMAKALLAATRELSSDPGVRAVVLCGAGKGFMAGGDLPTLQKDPAQGIADLLTPLNEAIERLAALDAPVIAKVHGAAAGAGMSMMLLADFAIAAEGTRFNFAYVNLGACCDAGASWSLPRMVGLRRALEIAMLGDRLSDGDALRLGVVNQLVPAAELDARVDELARRLAAGPTRSLGWMRRLMRSSFDRDLPAQLAAETAAFTDCAQTRDLRAGIDAFLNRTPVEFHGR